MPEKFESGSENKAEKEVLLTDEEVRYLKALVSREHAQARPESPHEDMSAYRLRELLLSKLG